MLKISISLKDFLRRCKRNTRLTLAFHRSSCYSFGMTSELYAEFDSPLPTLILHSENGLGIFVALAPDPMRRVHSTRMENNEFVIHFSDHEVRFPIRQNAMELVQAKGAVFAITDERGLPWFTQEFGVVNPKHGAQPSESSDIGDFAL